jgi:hypothetical protein
LELDPKKAVTFDLANGQVRLGPSEEPEASDTRRAVIVPAAAFSALIAAAGEVAARDLGRALGRGIGDRVRTRMSVREAGVEQVTSELATELALVGLGTLAFERWGRALVAVVGAAPVEGATGDAFIAATLEGALAAASGRELRTLPLARMGNELRVLVANVATIERAHGLIAEGASWGDAITRLHGGAS